MLRVLWSAPKLLPAWYFYTEDDRAMFDNKDAACRFIEAEKRNPDNRGRMYRIIEVLTMFA